jgi:hypothetical protein
MPSVRGIASRVFAATLLAVPGAARATAAAPPCFAAAFSPAFARDHIVLCLTNLESTGLLLYRSADAGRHWDAGHRVTGRRVALPDVILSPAFPSDPTLFVVGSDDGMWISRDGGRTFGAETDAPLFGAFGATPYVEQEPIPHAAFALASRAVVAAGVYDSLLGHRNVAGTPNATARFIIPPDYATTREAVAIGNDGTPGRSPVGPSGNPLEAFLCRGDFTCVTPVFNFGKVVEVHIQHIGPGDDVVVTYPRREAGEDFAPPSALRAWRSRDYGRTWTRWPGLESLFQRTLDPYIEDVYLAWSPDAPRRLFAQTNRYHVKSKTRPANQLWRSDDDGKTWVRVGYSFGPDQPHAGKGTLPWNDPGESIAQTVAWIRAEPGGSLYALGARVVAGRTTGQHLWCSRDLGRTWAVSC